jgi:competence CoiA-like predicted nuclease
MVNSMPRRDMNDRTPGYCQPHIQVLWVMDIEEIIQQIELRINPQVSLTQSHKGRYMQDP